MSTEARPRGDGDRYIHVFGMRRQRHNIVAHQTVTTRDDQNWLRPSDRREFVDEIEALGGREIGPTLTLGVGSAVQTCKVGTGGAPSSGGVRAGTQVRLYNPSPRDEGRLKPRHMVLFSGCPASERQARHGFEHHLVGHRPGYANRHHAPAFVTSQIEVIDLEGDDTVGDGGRETRPGGAAKDDGPAEERIVHRNDQWQCPDVQAHPADARLFREASSTRLARGPPGQGLWT